MRVALTPAERQDGHDEANRGAFRACADASKKVPIHILHRQVIVFLLGRNRVSIPIMEVRYPQDEVTRFF